MMHISDVLAETFRNAPTPENLTAWVDAQPIPGQMELPLYQAQCTDECLTTWCNKKANHTEPCNNEQPFCHQVNSEFTSAARPGADWGTWA